MNQLEQAAKFALEALYEYQAKGAPFMSCDDAVAALEAALLYSELMLVDPSCHERGCMALDCNATPVMVLGVEAKP